MQFPRYWIRLHQILDPATIADTATDRVDAWGWSDTSVEEARTVAEQRLAGAAQAARAGTLPAGDPHWYYPRMPLRENILGQVGEQALITRNRYGAVILNSPSLFIADIDLPGPEPAKQSRIGRLFGRKELEKPVDPAYDALVPVRSYAAANPSVGVRIYRTAAGLRVLLTGITVPAGSPQSRALLEQFGSDPLYVSLSATYSSYRARLTPKPWRCGLAAATRIRVPDGEPLDHTAFAARADWVAAYDRAALGYAVCDLIEVNGPAASADQAVVVQEHDRVCRVGSGLPLA